MADYHSQPLLPDNQEEWPEPGEGFVSTSTPSSPASSKDDMVHLDDLPPEAQMFT